MLRRLLPVGGQSVGLRRPGRIRGVDWSHPLSRGLIIAVPWGEHGIRDIATGYSNKFIDMAPVALGAMPYMDVSGPTWESPPVARTHFAFDTGAVGLLGQATDLTISAWGIDWTARTNGGCVWCERPSNVPTWKFAGPGDTTLGNQEAGLIRRNDAGDINRLGTTGNLLQDGGLHNVVLTVIGTTAAAIYVDGVSNNTATISGGALAGSDPVIGHDFQDTAANSRLNFPVPLILVWDRGISPDEVAQHYQHPWAVFKADAERSYFFPADASSPVAAKEVTRLAPYAAPGMRYGAFSPKAEIVVLKSGIITRLATYGGPGMIYGAFAPKTEAEAPVGQVAPKHEGFRQNVGRMMR